MLGLIGSNIMAVFRLLSPNEIDLYVTSAEAGVARIEGSRAAGGEDLWDASDGHLHDQHTPEQGPNVNIEHAEVIALDDFKKKKNRDEPKQTSELEQIGVLSASRIKEIEKARFKEEQGNKDSTTLFLIKEREKLRVCKKMLNEQHGIKSYLESNSHEFHERLDSSCEENSNDCPDGKGILINKKHY